MFPENFKIQTNDEGEQLVIPSRSVANYQWKDWNHRWLRSLHVDAQGRILSLGFPKFMNLNEGPGRYHVDEKTILNAAKSNLWATLKIDGTLLVRFVQSGKVKWRTRGSFGIGLDNKYELNSIFEAHSILNDPTYRPDDSVLFEWVSPENQIVIKYEKPNIFLIGGIRYDRNSVWNEANPQLYDAQELKMVAKDTGIELVKSFFLKSKSSVEKMIARIRNFKQIEGFVLRFKDHQEMVKVKSEHYFILHALKSNLTTNKLVELWLSWKKPKFNEFKQKFGNTYDFECWEYALPVVSSMYDGISKVNAIVEHVQKFVEERKNADRKVFALEAQSRFNQIRLTLCFLFYDSEEIPDRLILKLVLQNCKQIDRSMFRKNDDHEG